MKLFIEGMVSGAGGMLIVTGIVVRQAGRYMLKHPDAVFRAIRRRIPR